MASYDISSFMTWFLSQIYSMFSTIYNILDHIYLAGNVSLMDFSITIFILSLVIGILVAQPGNAMRVEKGVETKEARERFKAQRKSRRGG